MCVRDTVRRRAFSLAELLVVIVCIGILGGLAAGGFRNLVQAGREEAAAGKARLLNAARGSYGLSVADAEARWAGCASDAERLGLLTAAGLLDGTAEEHLYSDGGYAMSLGGVLRARTVLCKNGEPVAYR